MLSIEIHSDARTEDDLAEMLRNIANMVERGFVRNLEHPRFELNGDEEPYLDGEIA